MERTEAVLKFLGSQTYESGKTQAEPGERAFVTISRQAGAGGRALAAALLEEFAKRGNPVLTG